METKTVEKVVTIKQDIYIASDGKEFDDCYACQKYEREIDKRKYIRQAEELRIKDYEFAPIDADGIVSENNVFYWYYIENEEQFEILNKAYNNNLENSNVYPEIYCVETCGYEEYYDDAWSYTMTGLFNVTKEFWKKLGYDVKFTKE